MAIVKKATYTRPVPDDAKIVTKKRKRFARFRIKNRTIDAPLTKDGKRCQVETDEYYIRYKGTDGKWRRVKGYTDQDATRALALKLETKVARKQEGLADPFEEHTRRPILEHVDDFERHLEAKENTWKHVCETGAKVRRIVEACKFGTIADLAPGPVEAYLADQRRQGDLSAQTSNHYLRAIKQFSRWLVRDRRMMGDDLAHLSMVNVKLDRRHDRRALEVDEIARLIAAAESGPVIEAVPGPERAMFYMVALWTGYRRGEVASLTPRSFNLDGDPPTVTVEAAYSKRRRKDTIPLHPEVAERVGAYMALHELGPEDKLFDLTTTGGHWRKTSKMMADDLARARAAWIKEARKPRDRADREGSDFLTYRNEAGFFADAHALRHTFISGLGRAEVSPKVAQSLARHSDINLTMNVYTHLGLADQVSAIESLPAPPTMGDATPADEPVELRATGTDDAQVGVSKTRFLPPACQGIGVLGHTEAQSIPKTGGDTEEASGGRESPQTLKRKRLGTTVRVKSQVPPAGFEPATTGLGNRCSIP